MANTHPSLSTKHKKNISGVLEKVVGTVFFLKVPQRKRSHGHIHGRIEEQTKESTQFQ